MKFMKLCPSDICSRVRHCNGGGSQACGGIHRLSFLQGGPPPLQHLALEQISLGHAWLHEFHIQIVLSTLQ